MRQALAAIVLMAIAGPALAQMSPLGLWRSIDDKSGEPKAEIRIVEQAGALSGRIEKTLRKDAKPTCTECQDDRKGQPIVGLEIIRGAKQAEGKTVWEGGKILDPENGSTYSLKLTPTDGGRKLEVRGSIGPFGRTQTWTRVE